MGYGKFSKSKWATVRKRLGTTGVVVMLLAFETFKLGSFLTKIKTFCAYTKVINFFCNQFRDLLFGNFYKVSKTRPKVLD